MKRGAPKKNLDILPDNWKDEILALYAEGASDVEVKVQIHKWLGRFSDNLWNRWMEEEEDFWITIKRGRMLSQGWWEKLGRKNLQNKDFNATLWYMNMKNRFGWADSQKVDHTSGGEKISIKLIRG